MTHAERIIEHLKKSSPGQPEYYQAVQEVVNSLEPLLKRDARYIDYKILERIIEPERQYIFRVTWVDDAGNIQVNKGYRVQFNSAVGPYKGGLRFHPSVSASIVKFLGFEQIFKNALTGLTLGGGKGGADFDAKGKSEGEVMRFCQSFMTELYRHLGPTIDVPAGDIGVGAREIGYMYGQYKRLTRSHDGVLTGKGLGWGGSLVRKEATGYGAVSFAEHMLQARGSSLEGKRCAISGAGNVAQFTAQRLLQIGALPVTVSDSKGMIHHPQGIDVALLQQVKEVERASLSRYKELCSEAVYTPVKDYPAGRNAVWSVPCEAAFPSATQNEVNLADAKELIKSGCICVTEGANMPCTLEAVHALQQAGIAFGPAKCANAGGVATSQLEMAQNASMQAWTFDEVNTKLEKIMLGIFTSAHETAIEFEQKGNLVLGANIAGFRRVAENMIALGVI